MDLVSAVFAMATWPPNWDRLSWSASAELNLPPTLDHPARKFPLHRAQAGRVCPAPDEA